MHTPSETFRPMKGAFDDGWFFADSAPTYFYCKECNKLVHEDKAVKTRHLHGLMFCDDYCRDLWEDENAWEYM